MLGPHKPHNAPGRGFISPDTLKDGSPTGNSTDVILTGGAVYTGATEECTAYNSISVFAYSDVASATDGLQIQFSLDGENWDQTLSYDLKAATPFNRYFRSRTKFFRIVFTNGSGAQSEFRLMTILHVSRESFDENLVDTSAEGNTALKVFVQDQTTDLIDLYMQQVLATVTLAGATALDDKTIDLEVGHGFSTGEFLELKEGQNISEFEVIGVNVNEITLDSLVDHVFTTAAEAKRVNVNMAVDGSSTSIIFRVKPIAGQQWDITRIILVIEDASAMDFSLFGSITALTNGCTVRKKGANTNNIFNWKTNGEFINRSFDHVFLQNVGNNFRGFTSRSTFADTGKRGAAVKLVGDDGDELQIVIQDDLTDLSKVRMIAQGHEDLFLV